ncbi:hypothetical protein D9M72_338500 [compost metagenome]
MLGAAREAFYSPGPAPLQHREDLVTEKIPRERSVGVARILHPGEAFRAGEGLQFRTGKLQEWPGQDARAQGAAFRHARQTAHARPAQQAEEQRFRLVVTMLGAQQHFPRPQLMAEGGVAGIPGSPFQAGAGVDLHPQHLQRHSQFVADPLAMPGPGISRRLQAVMDMDGGNRR